MFVDDYKHKGLRNALVREIESKGIYDLAVLKAIRTIPRHVFFDEALLKYAYQDNAFPIGEGQTISQPYTVALQTQLLEILPGDKVLEIGSGSGYQSSVLLELDATLYTIERQYKLYQKAKQFLTSFGYKNFNCFYDDGSKGLEKHAPYDKIIVTAGAPTIPNILIHQLKIGGKLVIPVGNKENQIMIRITRIDEKNIIQDSFGTCSFVPLIGENGWNE